MSTDQTIPVILASRCLPGQLRHLAEKLTEGTGWVGKSVALTLEMIAAEHEGDTDLRRRLEHAEAALAGRSEGIRLWMLDCAEVASVNRQRAEKAEAEIARLEAELAAMRGSQPFR